MLSIVSVFIETECILYILQDLNKIQHLWQFKTKYINLYIQTVSRLFNSKTLFKDGDPVSSQLIFPGAIQTCKQIQQLFIHIY